MKYAIDHRLPTADADQAQRFHAAMLLRMHQVQSGAPMDLGNPLDVALTMMALWAKGEAQCLRSGVAESSSKERNGNADWTKAGTGSAGSNPAAGAPPPFHWPVGLLDRVKAAERRIADNLAPRRTPSDPNGEVDLVLGEVRHLIEGTWPPFWIKDGSGATVAQHSEQHPTKADDSDAAIDPRFAAAHHLDGRDLHVECTRGTTGEQHG